MRGSFESHLQSSRKDQRRPDINFYRVIIDFLSVKSSDFV